MERILPKSTIEKLMAPRSKRRARSISKKGLRSASGKRSPRRKATKRKRSRSPISRKSLR